MQHNKQDTAKAAPEFFFRIGMEVVIGLAGGMDGFQGGVGHQPTRGSGCVITGAVGEQEQG